MEAVTAAPRPQSPAEEVANSLSHGVALLLALAALPLLVADAAGGGGAAEIVGASVFGGTMVLLYLVSMLYHALPAGAAKRVFVILDHSAIFLLIAGTYTPFTLGVLRGPWGWSLFGVVWGLALLGIVFKCIFGPRCQALSTGLYLVMGWLVLVAAKTVWAEIPLAGLAWLLAGGVAYTLGVVFFVMDERVRFAHFIWHLFVIAGTACHFTAVMRYAV
jgi:hemolysin III